MRHSAPVWIRFGAGQVPICAEKSAQAIDITMFLAQRQRKRRQLSSNVVILSSQPMPSDLARHAATLEQYKNFYHEVRRRTTAVLAETGAGTGAGVGGRTSDRADGGLATVRSNADAEEDRAATIVPPVRPCAAWRVAEVQALPGYRLRVRFNDATEGDVDLSRLIGGPDAGVFAALRDDALFRQVHVALGAVTWPGDLDLAPDAMYRAIREHGAWIVE